MKRILMAMASLGIGVVGAAGVTKTTGIGKIYLNNTGLVYFTGSSGTDFACAGSGSDDERIYLPANFSEAQRKTYLSLVMLAKSLGKQVNIGYDNTGEGGKCELYAMEMQE